MIMLHVNELMIGDWVLDGNHIAQIVLLTCDGIIGTTFNESSNIEVVEPIPLTPEILEKNGFVWDYSPICQCWEQYGLIIYPAAGGYRMNCGQNVSFKIDSVHEIQHLFRLCGIDKEIVL